MCGYTLRFFQKPDPKLIEINSPVACLFCVLHVLMTAVHADN